MRVWSSAVRPPAPSLDRPRARNPLPPAAPERGLPKCPAPNYRVQSPCQGYTDLCLTLARGFGSLKPYEGLETKAGGHATVAVVPHHYRRRPVLRARPRRNRLPHPRPAEFCVVLHAGDRKSTRLNSSHLVISYA